MDCSTNNIFLDTDISSLFPIELSKNEVFSYSSRKIIFFGGILSIAFHLLFFYIISSHSELKIQAVQFGAQESKSLTVAIVSALPQKIVPSSIIEDVSKKAITTNRPSAKSSKWHIEKNITRMEEKSHPKISPEESEQPAINQSFVLQDVLDKVPAYIEIENSGSILDSKEFISMDPKIRKQILEQIKHDKELAYKETQSEISKSNQYFEYKSTGNFSMVRINGKCFVVPAGDVFLGGPKVWLHAGDCEKKKILNFGRKIHW